MQRINKATGIAPFVGKLGQSYTF